MTIIGQSTVHGNLYDYCTCYIHNLNTYLNGYILSDVIVCNMAIGDTERKVKKYVHKKYIQYWLPRVLEVYYFFQICSNYVYKVCYWLIGVYFTLLLQKPSSQWNQRFLKPIFNQLYETFFNLSIEIILKKNIASNCLGK